MKSRGRPGIRLISLTASARPAEFDAGVHALAIEAKAPDE
jgi:hypothetical protein